MSKVPPTEPSRITILAAVGRHRHGELRPLGKTTAASHIAEKHREEWRDTTQEDCVRYFRSVLELRDDVLKREGWYEGERDDGVHHVYHVQLDNETLMYDIERLLSYFSFIHASLHESTVLDMFVIAVGMDITTAENTRSHLRTMTKRRVRVFPVANPYMLLPATNERSFSVTIESFTDSVYTAWKEFS